MALMNDQPPSTGVGLSPARVRVSFLLALLAAVALGVVCGVTGLSVGLSLLIMALALVMALPGLITLAQLVQRR